MSACCAARTFVVDGGHNPQCLAATAAALERYYPGVRRVLLFGALADKDWREMARLMIPAADEFVCATPDSERALGGAELAEFLRGEGCRAEAYGTIEDAARAALERAGRTAWPAAPARCTWPAGSGSI